MKLKVSVTEAVELINQILKEPGKNKYPNPGSNLAQYINIARSYYLVVVILLNVVRKIVC